jgi:DNA-binding NtrC family response regulator
MHTVLLVDDDPDVLDSLSALLTFSGFYVIAACDAVSALTTIRQGARVDVVVTDYWMSPLNGSVFLDRLRTVIPNVPVIVLTGCRTFDAYRAAMGRGAFDFLSKPVRAADLRRVITSALSDGDIRMSRSAAKLA